MVKIKKEEVGFTQVSNKVLRDKNISMKAKGMFAYLFSKPNSWSFAEKRIALECSDSVRSVRTAISELEDAGYLQRKKTKGGRISYLLSNSRNVKVTKRQSDETLPLSNTEYIFNIHSNTEIVSTEGTSNDVKPVSLLQSREEFIKKCRDSKRRDVNLIGEYADEKRLNFTTKAQWHSVVRRNIRAAQILSPFTDEQIGKAMRKIKSKQYMTEWSLETLLKFLEH